MAKFNFNFQITGLDGKPVLGNDGSGNIVPLESAGKYLANQLCATTKVDAIKYFDMATKLYKGEIIDLDRSDTDMLKKFITDHAGMITLIKAKLLEPFEKVK